VIELVFAIAVVVAVLVVGESSVIAVRRVRRARRLRAGQVPSGGLDEQSAAGAGDGVAAVPRPESQQILDAASRRAEVIVGEARQRAAAIGAEARQAADALVREAEQKARTIVSAAEAERDRLQAGTERDRRLVDGKRKELSTLLLNLLAQVQQRGEDGVTNLRPLSDVRDARAGRGAPDD